MAIVWVFQKFWFLDWFWPARQRWTSWIRDRFGICVQASLRCARDHHHDASDSFFCRYRYGEGKDGGMTVKNVMYCV